jgi:hypothetical protein
MRGKELTRPTNDLSLIFWHIRTTRNTNARRSWQRRARLVLAKRLDLSDKDRHEIMCTWSRGDSHMVASEAMAKLLAAQINSDFQNVSPRLFKRFKNDGKKLMATKKPEQIRLEYGDAANDAIGCIPHTPRRLQRPCIHGLAACRAGLLTQSRQRSYPPRPVHAQGDSDIQRALNDGNHYHQPGPLLPTRPPISKHKLSWQEFYAYTLPSQLNTALLATKSVATLDWSVSNNALHRKYTVVKR